MALKDSRFKKLLIFVIWVKFQIQIVGPVVAEGFEVAVKNPLEALRTEGINYKLCVARPAQIEIPL
jgi:hypothetical protein